MNSSRRNSSQSQQHQHRRSSQPPPNYPTYYGPPPPYSASFGPTSSSSGPTLFNGLNSFANHINNFANSIVNNPAISNLMSGGTSSNPSRMNNSSYPSSNNSEPPSSSTGREVSCETCGARLGFFYRKKKTCADCGKDFCSSCFNNFGSSNQSSDQSTSSYHTRDNYSTDPRTRKFCRVFNQWPLDRRSLLNLRVKDLRWYLDRRHVNSNGCKEKSELVDLILRSNGINPSSYSYTDTTSGSSYRHRRRDSEDPLARSSSVQEESEQDRRNRSRSNDPSTTTTTTNNQSNRSSSNNSSESWELLDNDMRTPPKERVTASSGEGARVEDYDEDDDETRGATGYTPYSGTSVPLNVPTVQMEAAAVASDTEIESTPTGSDTFRLTTESLTKDKSLSTSAIDKSTSNIFNVEDIESEEQLNELSVRQLKLILARNFVDYKGCCERNELMNKVRRLWREKRESKQKVEKDEIDDENLCKICMESVIDCVLLECGHMISCVNCGKRLSECPICRQYVVRAVRIFRS